MQNPHPRLEFHHSLNVQQQHREVLHESNPRTRKDVYKYKFHQNSWLIYIIFTGFRYSEEARRGILLENAQSHLGKFLSKVQVNQQ